MRGNRVGQRELKEELLLPAARRRSGVTESNYSMKVTVVAVCANGAKSVPLGERQT